MTQVRAQPTRTLNDLFVAEVWLGNVRFVRLHDFEDPR